MLYKVVKYGDPVLETRADAVTEFGAAELRQLVEDMFETMYANKGVGLAAPQIGISKRLARSKTLASFLLDNTRTTEIASLFLK